MTRSPFRARASLPVLVAALALVGTAGCFTTHSVRQTSIVPAAAAFPAPTTAGDLDLYAGAAVPLSASTPDGAADDAPDVWIPRGQLDGAFGMHFGDHYGLRLSFRYGLEAGAMSARDTDLGKPDGGPIAFTIGNHVRLGAPEDRTRLDFVADFGIVSAPTSYVWSCADPAFCGDERGTGSERTGTFQYAVLLLGRYMADDGVDLMFGASIQNHPTNEGTHRTGAPGPQVDEGVPYAVPVLGVELEASEGVRIIPTLQWPVGADPVVYGPILGVAVRGVIEPSG